MRNGSALRSAAGGACTGLVSRQLAQRGPDTRSV